MAFDNKSLDDYVDVATRLAEFRERYPDGSLQPADPAHPWEQAVVNGYDKQGKPFAATMIVYVAAAYRTPDDQRPGIGVAWEPFPGRTPYTLGSELMNAETSAWGRAIVAALAADTRKGIATQQDVQHAREAQEEPPSRRARAPRQAPSPAANGRVQAKIPGPDHERLRNGTIERTPDDRPAARGPIPPDEDPWAGQPPGELAASQTPPEDRPGTIDGRQRSLIMAKLGKLGRDDRIARVAQIVGHDLDSTNDLSWVEAAKVMQVLEGAS